ncbi:tyrosine--tRNA ligase [Quadrisphaera setariae]|uniref:Tyrosine--tRNA ligase n=1 Tax=Quadrisphaera setariae TaxID=2593304 RepID=A0A5C8Z3E0_9ACTN|nr:tyrosine--tRNA ligase [Quadrisphaera setariae]TXR52615.1 tyrosine--tRNA ligase [Quadrisphaera setariae]
MTGTPGSGIIDELRWRGVLAQSTDEDALRAALDAGPVTFYVGFDPTAPSLHMGNLVQLVTAKRLQDAGHVPLLLVGGSTGLVGDPRMSGERVLNDPEVVAGWVARIAEQVRPFVSFDGPNAARLVNNLDWTAPMSAIEFLRDVGKHFRVGRMLAKEAVSARMSSDEGISFTEFSYQILQGMDYLELFRRYGCTLQTGGSDQWGNITSGVDLIHRVEGTSVHALSTQLITKPDGTKFGKTESGTVWLSPEMTSPYAFYQFWLAAEDAAVDWYLRVFTQRTREELAALAEETAARPQARAAQRLLAQDVTTLVHGADVTARVEAASAALFGQGDLTSLDADTLGAALAELPTARVSQGEQLLVPRLLAEAGVVPSASAGRRAVAEGGAYVNNERWADADAPVEASALLHGRWLVLRRGKRTLAAVDTSPAGGA